MKKMTFGIVIISFFISCITYATTSPTQKDTAVAPYYGSGFSFGLADYSKTLSTAPSTDITFSNKVNQTEIEYR